MSTTLFHLNRKSVDVYDPEGAKFATLVHMGNGVAIASDESIYSRDQAVALAVSLIAWALHHNKPASFLKRLNARLWETPL